MNFTIQDIINTLNHVEVRGKENLDRLLSAIIALEAVVKAEQTAKMEEQEKLIEEEKAKAPQFDEETKIYAEE